MKREGTIHSEEQNRKIYPVITMGLLLGIWEITVDAFHLPGYLLPAPSDIIAALITDHALLFQHAKVTACESVIGIGCSLVLAVTLSILMDNFRIIRESLYPLLIVSQTIPTMAIAPLVIIWFGFGVLPKIVTIVLVCFFPIVVALADGFAQVDQDYLNLFRASGATRRQTYLYLKLPCALPSFFSGLKISVTYMLTAAIIGEWLGGDQGIGVYIVRAKNAFSLDKVFAAVLLVVLVSVILIQLINMAGRKIIHWK